jgi:hypothetical protein
MALVEKGISGSPIGKGDYVLVRCQVTQIISANAGLSFTSGTTYGGCADHVYCTVQTPGNPGEISGVSFYVSPVQCRKAGSTEQA